MPRIFKENKFALLGANIIIIALWISLSTLVINLLEINYEFFYTYKMASLIKFLPSIWITWFLWIKRGGFKK